MVRFSMASLLAMMAVAALACAGLLNPNVYFGALFQALMLGSALLAVYMAIVCRGDRQRLAIGFAVFAIGLPLWTSFLGDSLKLSDRLAVEVSGWHGYTMSFTGGVFGSGNYPPTTSVLYEPTFIPSDLTGSPSLIAGFRGNRYEPMDYGSLRVIIQSLLSLAVGMLGILVAVMVKRLEKRTGA